MMTRGGGRGVKNAENLMTSYVNDPLLCCSSVGYLVDFNKWKTMACLSRLRSVNIRFLKKVDSTSMYVLFIKF